MFKVVEHSPQLVISFKVIKSRKRLLTGWEVDRHASSNICWVSHNSSFEAYSLVTSEYIHIYWKRGGWREKKEKKKKKEKEKEKEGKEKEDC